MATEAKRHALQEYLRCEDDPWYFLTHYVKTFDPKAAMDGLPAVRLFPNYDYLRDIVPLWAARRNLHVLKSRQMIITTLLCGLTLHALLFEDGYSSILTSRKDTLVDDGGSKSTWNSLFGRVRFMYDNLPWFFQLTFDVSYNRITNTRTGSYIVGETSGAGDVGVSGVYTRGIMDEAALYEHGETVFRGLNDACGCMVMVSTPRGKHGPFYRIHKADKTTFERVRIHWSQHPMRDQAWYERECIDRTPEQIAQELDCRFEGSASGRCIPEFSYERRVRPDIVYDFQLPLGAGWDFGIGAPTAVVFSQRNGSYWRVPMSLQRADLNAPQFAELATGVTRRMGYEGTTKSIQCWGDPAGAARSMETGRQLFAAYRDCGWDIRPADDMRSPSEWIRKIRVAMSNDHWFCHPDNTELIDCLENMVYPTNPDGVVLNTELPDPKKHEFTHLPAAHGYHLGSVVREGAYRGGPIHIRGV